MITLAGSHRTGKTTLAHAFAQAQGIPFLRTSAVEAFRAMGKDPKVQYPIEERFAIQKALLHVFVKQYVSAQQSAGTSGLFITDRSPLDLAAYMLADMNRGTADSGMGQAVKDFVGECIDATNRFFSLVMVVQPGIPVTEEEGKAPTCPGYMEHLNTLMLGLLLDPRLASAHYYIPRAYVALETRLQATYNVVRSLMEAQVEATRTYRGAKALH